MFHTGDYLIYGKSGICQVIDVGYPQKTMVNNYQMYYTLRPVFSTEVIYTPVDTTVYMRAAMTKRQAEEFIQQIPYIEEEMPNCKTNTDLKEHYETSIQTHKLEALVRLIKAIYNKNLDIKKSGRQINQIDQKYMKLAETLLYGELAVALDIPRESVVDYIKSSLVSEKT